LGQPLATLEAYELPATPQLQQAVAACLATQQVQQLSLTLFPPEKPRAYFQVTLQHVALAEPLHLGPLPNVDTAAPLVLLVFEDQTKMILTEKMRRDFVANVSHELRTPLAVLKGYAETLLAGAIEEPAVARDFVQTMEQHANRLTRLVEELLDLSSFEAEHFALELEPMALAPALQQAVALCQPRATEKTMQLRLPSPASLEALPWVLAQRNTLEQVLVNLIDNAIKYSPDNTTVSVSVEALLQQANHPATHVRVVVADEGIGIEAKFIPRLFERFYRVDKSRSRHLGSTGLGLAIVKHLVQMHGGEVGVESTPGKGSRFFFTLKLAG
jgi:two-component system phosphate regulon sensor histidine kinase PhoR